MKSIMYQSQTTTVMLFSSIDINLVMSGGDHSPSTNMTVVDEGRLGHAAGEIIESSGGVEGLCEAVSDQGI